MASVLNIPSDFTYYFGLFLVEDPSGKHVVRKLQEFESPFISLKRVREADPNSQYCIQVREREREGARKKRGKRKRRLRRRKTHEEIKEKEEEEGS